MIKSILVSLFSGLLLIVNAQSNVILESHIQKFKNAKDYTHKIASLMGAENFDFKPVKEEMSFKEQLVHIGENIFWLSSTYIKEIANPIKNKLVSSQMSKEEVILFVDSAYDFAISAMEKMDTSSMNKEFPWSGNLKLNKSQFLNLIEDHQAHHVGQIIVYLRLNNITPPKYIGW